MFEFDDVLSVRGTSGFIRGRGVADVMKSRRLWKVKDDVTSVQCWEKSDSRNVDRRKHSGTVCYAARIVVACERMTSHNRDVIRS